MRPKEDARRRAQCKQAAHVGCNVGNVEAAHEAEGDQEAPTKVLHRVAESLPVQQHVVDLQGGDADCWAPVRSMQAGWAVDVSWEATYRTDSKDDDENHCRRQEQLSACGRYSRQ